MALNWEGLYDLLAGKIYFKRNEQSGPFSIDLLGGEEKCSGSYIFEPDLLGTWEFTCPDGVTASGTMKGYGFGKGGTAEGEDNKGRKIRFTVSSR